MSDEASIRLQRLELLRSKGIDPYPSEVTRTHTVAEVLRGFDELLATQTSVSIVGRVRLIRKHGGLTFLQLQDGSGAMQAALKKDVLEKEAYDFFHESIDIGDFLQMSGSVFLTKKGEQTVLCSSYVLLSKSLEPLPEKWHGLTDVEARYRQRELDLIVNPEVKERFIKRSKLISSLRHFLDERGFLEVETPILQPIPGGASARPFVTHHNALDAQFYLRIAPELYLKRLLVGGFEKIYEIGKVFRNEGIDYAHNPEFTMLELYWSFCKSRDTFIDFLEELVRTTMQQSIGSLRVPYGEEEIDFGVAWPRKTFRQAIIDSCHIDIDNHQTESSLISAAQQQKLGVDFAGCIGMGEHFDQLYKKTAREQIVSPTWIFDYPLDLKPLTKASPDDPTKSASVQLVVHGMEIVNAYYHELIDPIDQRQRFLAQEMLRERGSEEAQFVDEEFLSALEHAMPPTSGVGIGIDRFIAFLTNAPNLKEVILFPTLRPKSE